MDRIDSHQHFWNYDPAKHVWMNDDMALLKRDSVSGHCKATPKPTIR